MLLPLLKVIVLVSVAPDVRVPQVVPVVSAVLDVFFIHISSEPELAPLKTNAVTALCHATSVMLLPAPIPAADISAAVYKYAFML